MAPIHCHRCGGFLGGDLQAVAFQPAMSTEDAATPHSALCACVLPAIYGSVSSTESHR